MGKFLMSLMQLDTWFQSKKRILPWRDRPTLYRVWVSEIMLQQTQVITVIPYFERFLERFPTVEDLAQASEEDVLLLWSGLGYYSRARNLHRGAKKVAQNGRFPVSRDEWLEIPGVGNYTAGAILSIAANQAEPILDGNIERVLSRVRRVSRQKGDGFFKTRLWKISEIFVKTADRHGIQPSNLNQSLMELGATICSPRSPQCGICPLSKLCQAFASGEQESYPPKKKPKKWIQVQEKLHCVVNDSGLTLLRLRKKGEWRAGLWDLLDQEPSFKLKSVGQVETRHVVTRHKIQRLTQVWRISHSKKSELLSAAESELDELKWVSIKAPEVPVGSALKRTLKQILSEYPIE